MDGHAAAALPVIGTQPAHPADRGRDRVGPVADGDRRAEVDQGMASGVALPVPRPSAADRDLELDHRLQPVDVGAFEEAGLDQSHGPGRIARCRRPRLRVMSAPTMPPSTPTAAELDALRSAVAADVPAYLADLERLVNIDCGSYTPDGVDQIGRFVAAFLEELGAGVEIRP